MNDSLTSLQFSEVLSGTIGALNPQSSEALRQRMDVSRLTKELFGRAEALAASELKARAETRTPDRATSRLVQRALALHSLRGRPSQDQARIDAHSVVRSLFLEDPELSPAVFRTPFGFVAIRLFASEIDKNHIRELIRIHIWQEGVRPEVQSPETTIHSHELSTRSWILNGQIINELYTVKPIEDADAPHALYTISRDRYAKSALQNTGTHVQVNMKTRQTYARGETYEVPLGDYHRTHVLLEDYTVTLFYFGNTPGWQQSFTVGPTSGLHFETNHVKGYTEEKITSILGEFRERIL